MPKRRATIREVAHAAGVSVQTVSNVLNGRDDQMGEETRRRVSEAIRSLEYHRNPSARRLRVSAGDTFGFLILDEATRFLADPATDLFLAGIADVLRERDYSLLIQASKPGWPFEPLLEPLLGGRIDGAVVILSGSAARRRSFMKRLAAIDEPLVLIQEHGAPRRGLPSVLANDREASRALCRHLLERGHERIAFLTSEHRWSAIEERHAGYLAALREAELEPDPEMTVSAGEFRPLDARDAAAALLDHPRPPSAIMCSNDQIALGAMMAARDRGLRIPEDLAVTGFDDFEFAVGVEPALTTVAMPGYEMGRCAAERLLGPAADRRDLAALFQAEVRLRGST
jgi:LacI family transcriptional regulator